MVNDGLSEIKTAIANLTEGSEFLSVTTPEEYKGLLKMEDTAVGFKKQIKEYWNGTEEKPGPIPKAYDVWKELCSKRNALLDPIESFLKVTKRIGGAYLAKEQQKQQEQAAALQKQATQMGLDTSLIPQEAPKPNLGGGRTLVQTWTFRVVDENQVPREYLVLDTKKIQGVVTALKDKTNIPGVEVFKENTIRRTATNGK